MDSRKLPEIPSELIEPYLVRFMETMIQFAANACITNDELNKERGGVGHTIQHLKAMVDGVETFVSQSCEIHARFAMMNELSRWQSMPDEELRSICRKVYYQE